MRAFAALVDALVYTRSRNGKLALVAQYLRETPDPDRGWAWQVPLLELPDAQFVVGSAFRLPVPTLVPVAG